MFSVKKRAIAFGMAVCCMITMVFGTTGMAAGQMQPETPSAANAITNFAAGPATGSVAGPTTGPTAGPATGPAAEPATGPVFDPGNAAYLGLSLMSSFAAPASQGAVYYFNTNNQKAYYQIRAFVTSGAAFHITIYDATATNEVGSADLTNGAYERFALNPSTRYYLYITGAGYISGDILVSPIKDDYQDTRQTAALLPFNKECAVNTDIANDVDYLRFTIGSQDATYYLRIEPTAGRSGTYELQDASGNRISAYSGSTNQSTVIYKKLTLTKNRTYYLKISSSEAYRQVVVSISMAINRYKIYYHLNGGSNVSSNPSSYVATNTVKLKNPKRKGYTFAGWYTSPKLTGRITTIRGTAKKTYHLYAKWKRVTVKKVTIKSFTSKKEKNATVKFKKLSGVKGYQVRIGLTKKLTKKCKNYTKKTATVNFKKLKTGKRYYIAVRAYKLDSTGKRVYGAYSKIKSVKIYKKKPVKKADSKKDKKDKKIKKK